MFENFPILINIDMYSQNINGFKIYIDRISLNKFYMTQIIIIIILI